MPSHQTMPPTCRLQLNNLEHTELGTLNATRCSFKRLDDLVRPGCAGSPKPPLPTLTRCLPWPLRSLRSAVPKVPPLVPPPLSRQLPGLPPVAARPRPRRQPHQPPQRRGHARGAPATWPLSACPQGLRCSSKSAAGPEFVPGVFVPSPLKGSGPRSAVPRPPPLQAHCRSTTAAAPACVATLAGVSPAPGEQSPLSRFPLTSAARRSSVSRFGPLKVEVSRWTPKTLRFQGLDTQTLK